MPNPPTSPERRACETTFHQPAAASQQQPASCSQPAKPASQPSQPTLHLGIEASGLQASMAPNSYIGASSRFPQPATARHRLPQVATARHRLPNFLAPTAPGEQPNMPQTYQISTIWPTSQQIMWGGSFGSLTSHKIGHGTTLGRPFHGFRPPTKIL